MEVKLDSRLDKYLTDSELNCFFFLAPAVTRTALFGKKKNSRRFGKFFCRNVRRHVFAETSCSPLGYVPISSSAPRPLGAAYIPISLSEVEQEQRPSGNGDRESVVVGAGLCDGEGKRAYIAYIMRDVSANFLAWDVSAYFFCRNVRRHVFAETSGIRCDL